MEQLEVIRTFDAPLQSLWQAWTDPAKFKKWYGPKGFTIPTCEIDLKVGGRHLWSMRSPDGMEMYFSGKFIEVNPMDKLVYSDGMSDSDGNPMSMEGMPPSMDVTVTFSFADGKTTVTLSHMGSGPDDPAAMGWNMAFDKLTDLLQDG